VLPPVLASIPSSFQVLLSIRHATPDTPSIVVSRTHPEHTRIDLCLNAFARLAPLINLPEGGLTAAARAGSNEVVFTPNLPSTPVTGFLSMLTLLGADDLAEVRRQVRWYPYEKIASEYERFTHEAKRTRRVMPTVILDTAPFLSLEVVDVLGGPSVMIRLSEQRDVIRLRGLPFNQTFARLANDALMKNMRAAIRARLPILGNSRSDSAAVRL
jgi:hypothetical protein